MRKKVFLVLLFWFVSIPAFAQQPIVPPPTREEFNELIKKTIQMKKELVDEMTKIRKEVAEVKAEAKKSAGQKSNSPAPVSTQADSKTLKDLERRIVHAQRGVNRLEKIAGGRPIVVNGWGPNDTRSLAYGLADLALKKATRALSEAQKSQNKAENAYDRADQAFLKAAKAQKVAVQNSAALKELAETTARALERQANKRAVKNPLYWRDDKNLKSLASMIRRTAQ